jgi:hypothetical protein
MRQQEDIARKPKQRLMRVASNQLRSRGFKNHLNDNSHTPAQITFALKPHSAKKEPDKLKQFKHTKIV